MPLVICFIYCLPGPNRDLGSLQGLAAQRPEVQPEPRACPAYSPLFNFFLMTLLSSGVAPSFLSHAGVLQPVCTCTHTCVGSCWGRVGIRRWEVEEGMVRGARSVFAYLRVRNNSAGLRRKDGALLPCLCCEDCIG